MRGLQELHTSRAASGFLILQNFHCVITVKIIGFVKRLFLLPHTKITMTSLITIFKVLRCIGLFPRRFIAGNETSSSHLHVFERNEPTIGPVSLLYLIMAIIFHITSTVLKMFFLHQLFMSMKDNDDGTFGKIGLISLNILWVWLGAFAGWLILLNNGKLKKLNSVLVLLQSYKNVKEKSLAKFPRCRLFWVISIPIWRYVLFFAYIRFEHISTENKIIWIITAMADEILKVMIEYTFWQIAKLHRGIITNNGRLYLEDCSPSASEDDMTCPVQHEHTFNISRNINLKNLKNNSCYNLTGNILDRHLLQTENHLASIQNCAQYAMSCFNYVIMFQMIDIVFGIVFSVYFGITKSTISGKIFYLVDLSFYLPRLVIIATLSSTINHEVCVIS